MSNSIQSVQAANAQTQIENTVQPPKKAPAQNSIPQDTVTISKASQQPTRVMPIRLPEAPRTAISPSSSSQSRILGF